MDGQALAIKFSNDIYATRSDVSREMKTNLIDGIWTGILNYRKNFYVSLKLRHIDSTAYSICMTPTISNNVSAVERKLTKLMAKYSDLNKTMSQRDFDINSKKKVLRSLANIYNLSTSDDVLYEIARGTALSVSQENQILLRYSECLDLIANFPSQDIDDSTIGNFYSKLLNDDDLTEFYRTKELDNKFSKVSSGRVYLGLPVNCIDKSMDQLMNFIQYSDKSLSSLIKAVCTFYFIYYVKPFESFSEEIATLMFKKILAVSDYGRSSAFLNVETLLENKDRFEPIFFECQKTYDLTYFLVYCIKVCDQLVEEALDDVALSEKNSIRQDFYQKDENYQREPDYIRNNFHFNEDRRSYNNFDDEEVSYAQTKSHEIKHEEKTDYNSFVKEFEKEEVKEETKPVIEEKPIIELKKEEVIAPVSNVEETPNENFGSFAHESLEKVENKSMDLANNIAISNVPAGLDEADASKLESRLLEMNPNLSRGQAYFYARHCTIGASYTIQQYKKEVGCAYETARCSMDNLVTLGYYIKKQFKNKYIYTPVKR